MATARPAQPAAAAPSAPQPGVAALPVTNRGLLTFGVMLATIMQILDTTIANVALPHMQTTLGATADTVTWVLTSYIVASAIAIPITGWLSDRIGSRNLFLISTVGFIIASMLCGMAQSLEEMVVFRLLQGVSAAFIEPAQPDGDARHQPARAPGQGDVDLGHGDHGRADHGPGDRRLADRQFQLALGVLRQSAVGRDLHRDPVVAAAFAAGAQAAVRHLRLLDALAGHRRHSS